MHGSERDFGLLLAAHGERGATAENSGMVKLAAFLRKRAIASQVAYGFIKGSPTIAEAMRTFGPNEVVVYPLFMSDGYFTRVRLAQLLDDTRDSGVRRSVEVLAPLGTDPRLAHVVTEAAERGALRRGFRAGGASLLLVAHGSTKEPASRVAAIRLIETIHGRGKFADVGCAFLEEAPSIAAAIGCMKPPVIAIGLFAGEGLHGARDVPRLLAATGGADIEFLGNVGSLPGISDMIVSAVRSAS
jgi:sirohydrochlorin cobaltochelatase